MKINIVFGNHTPNIGNGFLDLGSKASIILSDKSSNVLTSSCFPTWYHNTQKSPYLLSSKKPRNNISLPELYSSDFCVFSGMIMHRGFINRYGEMIKKMTHSGKKVILNGAGAARYDKGETDFVKSYWKDIGLHAFIARDPVSFELYSDIANEKLNGIDCAFFLEDAYTPEKLNIDEYDVINFDSTSNNELPESLANNIVYTHHRVFPLSKVPRGHLARKNTLISERVEDYLDIYYNAKNVFSDRVHACVASLTYGNKCRLYDKTPRAHLFENVGITKADIENSLVSLDKKLLKKLKRTQTAFIKEIIQPS